MPAPNNYCNQCGEPYSNSSISGLCQKCLHKARLEKTEVNDLPEVSITSDSEQGNDSGIKNKSGENTKIHYFGDYELLQEIARGGMGVVYKARQVTLNRIVALKMILSGQFASEADVKRFHVEAEAAAQLDHPGIIPIFEIGQHENQYFFSMAFIDGESLAARLSHGPIPADEAAGFIIKLAEAMQYAHEKNVIHRDLKPANILFDETGEPRITDFGLAKRIEGDSTLTVTGQIMGTPGYMPPEQALSEAMKIGPLSDLYSLGAILYCMLTGRPPFQSSNVSETLFQVIHKEPVSPKSLNAEISLDLDTIVLKCLEKDPGQRYDTCQDLEDDLQRYLDGKPILARPLSQSARLWRLCKRNPIVTSLLTLLVFSLVVGFSVSLYFAAESQKRAEESLENATKAIKNEKAAKNSELATKIQRSASENKTGLILAAKSKYALEKKQYNEAHLYALHALNKLDPVNEESTRARMHGIAISEPNIPRIFHSTPAYYHDLLVFGLKLHPNKKTVIIKSYDPNQEVSEIRLWEIKTGQLKSTFKNASIKENFDYAISPDGKVLAYGTEDKTILLYDLISGNQIKEMRTPSNYIFNFSFSADSNNLLLATFNYEVKNECLIHLWNLQTHKKNSILIGNKSEINNLMVSPDGKELISASKDNLLRLWDVESGQLKLVLKGHSKQINFFDFSPNGNRLVSGSDDQTVRLWNLNTGKQENICKGHTDKVNLVAFSPDGKTIASGSSDKTLRLWNMETGKLNTVLKGHEEKVTNITFSQDGKLIASASSDKTIRLWNINTGKEKAILKGETDEVKIVAFTPDGKKLTSVSRKGMIRLWNAKTGQQEKFLSGRSEWINTLTFSPDGMTLATGSDDNTIGLWDVKTGKQKSTLIGHTNRIGKTVFSPDGKTLISISNNQSYSDDEKPDLTIRLWNAKTGKQNNILKGHTKNINAIVISHDGSTLATGSDDGTIRLWDVKTGKQISVLKEESKGYNQEIEFIAFSPDGNTIVSVPANEKTCLWNIDTGLLVKQYDFDIKSKKSILPSPDGIVVVSQSDDKIIRLWDLITGNEKAILRGHTTITRTVALSRDGKTFASGLDDGNIRLWDIKTGKQKAALNTVKGWTGSIAFSPDGKTLATGSTILELWNIDRFNNNLKYHEEAKYYIRNDQKDFVHRSAVSKNGNLIALISEDDTYETLTIWDSKSGKIRKKFDKYPADIFLTNDSKTADGIISHDIYYLDDWTDPIISENNGHLDNNIVPSPFGKTVAFTSFNPHNGIYLWNIESGTKKTLDGDTSWPNTIAFSPYGKTVALASDEKPLSLWDLKTKKQKVVLKGFNKYISSLVFSPDNQRLAFEAYDSTYKKTPHRKLYYWNVETGNLKTILSGYAGWIGPISFSSDGTKLVYSLNQSSIEKEKETSLHLWDLKANKQKNIFSGHPELIFSVVFSPDGKTLAYGSDDKTVRIWNIETGKQEQIFKGHTDSVNSVTFSPDGKTLVSGSDDRTIRLWNVNTGKERKLFKGHKYAIDSVTFSPDGKIVASKSENKSLRLWDIKSGKQIEIFNLYPQVVTPIDTSPDGNVMVFALRDNSIRLWNVNTGKQKTTLSGHSGRLRSIAFSPDGKTVVSGSDDQTLRLWDAKTGKQKKILKGHTDSVNRVSFSPDGKMIASGSEDGTIRLWDVKTGKQKTLLTENSKENIQGIEFITFSPDGKTLASVSESNDKGIIHLWDIESKQVKTNIKDHTDFVTSVVFSPDGKILISGSDNETICFWNAKTGHLIKEINTEPENIFISEDLKTAAFFSSEHIYLWDIENDRFKTVFNVSSELIHAFAFSPDNKTVALSSDDHLIRLWDMETGKQLEILKGHKNRVYDLIFSPDGKTILSESSEDDFAFLWDVETGKQKATLHGGTNDINSVAFSPDGKTIASVLDFSNIYLWDVDTEKQILVFNEHSDIVRHVIFSPDGKTIASASDSQTIRLWDVKTGNQKAIIKGNPDFEFKKLFYSNNKICAIQESNDHIQLFETSNPLDLDINSLKYKIHDTEELFGFKLDNTNLVARKLQPNLYGNSAHHSLWPSTHPYVLRDKAEAGDVKAMVQLGIIHDRNGQNNKAIKWYKMAADAGDSQGRERFQFLTKLIDNKTPEKMFQNKAKGPFNFSTIIMKSILHSPKPTQ